MTEKTEGFGVIGVGTAGGWYADILRRSPDAKLVAALRSSGGDTKAVEEVWRVPCFDDIEAFLRESDLNAVIIATPSGQHYAQAKAALEAGKHVLIEKPITLEPSHASDLISLARDRNLRLGVTFQRRADPFYQAVKRAVDSDAFGRPILLSITMPYFRGQDYYDSAAWRGTKDLDGGGVLMNQGIHLVDLALWMFGEVKEVHALSKRLARDIQVEDTAVVGLEFQSGALGSICGTTASKPGVAHSVELCGTEGSLRIEGERIIRWDVPGSSQPQSDLLDSSAADPKQTSTVNHARVVEDFIRAIREGRDPLVTGEMAKGSLELIQSAYQLAGE